MWSDGFHHLSPACQERARETRSEDIGPDFVLLFESFNALLLKARIDSLLHSPMLTMRIFENFNLESADALETVHSLLSYPLSDLLYLYLTTDAPSRQVDLSRVTKYHESLWHVGKMLTNPTLIV